MNLLPVVLVVEDEPAIAELIAINLRHNGFKPILALDSKAAQAALDDALPTLILLDWMLPGESGLTLTKRWRLHPRTQTVPIIMLTARGDELDRVAGLDAGADDYIAKPFSTKELLARIRAVLRRRAPDHSLEAVNLGDLSLDTLMQRVTFRGHLIKLGGVEFKLLQYLMIHPERVYSRVQLLEKIWGDQVYIEERTVDVHVKRLREALGESAARMIETVRGAGYRFTTLINPDIC
jgi:two-component system phosphate regulon response regulator PhoB